MSRPFAILAAVVLAAAGAGAQDAMVAEPGSILRLTIANGHQRMVGDYMARKGDAIEFTWRDKRGDEMRQTIALRDINRIEITRGRSHPYAITVLKGAAIGIAIGIVAGRISGMPSCPAVGDCLTVPEATALLAGGLGAVGGTIGFIRARVGFYVWSPATVTGWRPD